MIEQRFYVSGSPGSEHTRLDFKGRRWWLTLIDVNGEGVGVRIPAGQAHHIRDHFFNPDGTHRRGGFSRVDRSAFARKS